MPGVRARAPRQQGGDGEEDDERESLDSPPQPHERAAVLQEDAPGVVCRACARGGRTFETEIEDRVPYLHELVPDAGALSFAEIFARISRPTLVELAEQAGLEPDELRCYLRVEVSRRTVVGCPRLPPEPTPPGTRVKSVLTC
jgi:hypothetical protein